MYTYNSSPSSFICLVQARYCVWGYESTQMSITRRTLLMSSIVMLPIWSLLSWRMMQGRKAHHAWIILGFGSPLLLYYAMVIRIAVQEDCLDENPYQLGLVILTVLQCIETSAYLVVVACLKDSLVQDDTDEQHQYQLI